MKFITLHENAAALEAAKPTLACPQLAATKDGYCWCKLTDNLVDVIYTTDPEVETEIDSDHYYQYDGEIEIDGQTYYKWMKISDIDWYPEAFLTWLITEHRTYEDASLDNMYKHAGTMKSDDSYDDEYLSNDKIVGFGKKEKVVYGRLEYHDMSDADKNSVEYVDLGLASGALWAKYNLGADESNLYGDYYAWGETSTKNNYSWREYKWYNDTSNTLTKYNTKEDYGANPDNVLVLELSDDAAREKCGGDWHMPDHRLIAELMSLPNEWTDDYDGSGIAGRIFTGTNGNELFIPAAGWFYGSDPNLQGSNCGLWSLRLYADSPFSAYYLGFNSDSIYLSLDNRYIGFSVRPVLY